MLLTLLLLAVAGCGGRGVDLVNVSGTVTHKGAPPRGPGTLYFTPADPAPGQPRRPGIARFDAAGHYAVGSFEKADGLVPGRYLVTVDCWEVPPTIDGPPAKSFIPARYGAASTSGIELNIPNDSATLTFDINLDD